MKLKIFMLSMALAGFMAGLLVVSAQDQDDDVRGAFLSSRPKTTSPPRRPRGNKNTGGPTPPKNSNVAKNVNATVNESVNGNASGPKNMANHPVEPIGLGYTLYMRDDNGRPVRVEPNREFHNGDRVRISLEPNVDGYLYVFHSEGSGPAEMIYPDARLEGGENWVEAHVPMEVPSSEEMDERLRWFQFYGNAGTERLYVVVTREPLPNVPTAGRLVSFCSANKDQCPWRPTVEIWARLQDAGKANVRVVTSNTFGSIQTEKEKEATTRGLGLDQSAPQPSVIRMNAASNAPILVTVLDLIHK
jgi:hypothetical protein